MQFTVVMISIAVFVLLLVGGLTLISGWGQRRRDPEELLAERFAKGEIDEQEYSRRLYILRYGPPIELD